MLAICCLSLFIVGLDATIVNVALPAIGRDFRAPVSGLQWTIDAYLLVIASLLMLSGATADRVGRRGPVIGGALVDSVGWRGVFWVNLPVGVAAVVLTALFVPESRAARGRRPDPFGQILIIALLGTVSYAIIEGPAYGWGSARILACLAVAVAALAAFLVYEPRRQEPLVDLRFFRSLPFSGAALTAVTGLCAFGGFLFLITPSAARTASLVASGDEMITAQAA